MSVKNPAWRYLPKERPRDSDERSLMFDRANATESVIRILNDEFDCGIPEGGEGKSWKFFCFSGDTKVITKDGVYRLDEAPSETYLWSEDRWVRGTVRSYGQQPLQEITFRPMHRNGHGKWQASGASKFRVTVRATKLHRWLLTDGLVTQDIRVGDAVPGWRLPEVSTPEGAVRGFVYGDGSMCNKTQGPSSLYRAPMHADKDVAIQHELDALEPIAPRVACPPTGVFYVNTRQVKLSAEHTASHVPIGYVRSWEPLKELPSQYTPGFLRGWLLADGSADTQRAGKEHLFSRLEDGDWLVDWAAMHGRFYTGKTVRTNETNFGVRRPSAEFTLVPEVAWQVVAISGLSEPEEVWCAETESGFFTLASGIATGNCPWGDEHSDAGLDKAARYFWDTDHVYCFAGHDVLDVVTIRAMQWHVTKYEAARRLLTKYAEVRVPYAERLATLAAKVRAPEQPRALSVEQAQQALVAALSSVQGYTEAQYRPEVREALAGSLEALQGHWGMDDVLGWVEESCGRVASAIAQGESHAKQG